MLWGRPGSRAMAQLKAERKNSYIELPEPLLLTENLTEALEFADVVIISISAQQLRDLAKKRCV